MMGLPMHFQKCYIEFIISFNPAFLCQPLMWVDNRISNSISKYPIAR